MAEFLGSAGSEGGEGRPGGGGGEGGGGRREGVLREGAALGGGSGGRGLDTRPRVVQEGGRGGAQGGTQEVSFSSFWSYGQLYCVFLIFYVTITPIGTRSSASD